VRAAAATVEPMQLCNQRGAMRQCRMQWRIGEAMPDGRWCAPAAERNKEPIVEVLARWLPAQGLVLEIGSGTGQHVAHFARRLPALAWQPSEREDGMRRSIEAWIAAEHVANVRAVVTLDIDERPWPVARADAIVCINVIHVSPWRTVPALFEGAAGLLSPGGVLTLYGPFRRAGAHTAPSNAAFDAQLRAHDPRWGVRDLEDVAASASVAGFGLAEIAAMPANNLMVLFVRQGDGGAGHAPG
jgi:SAM-dependent methyltransferase